MKTKCYSVRLQNLVSISDRAYRATAFDGSTAIIPKSQVYGPDETVHKSEAWWIAAWILEKKNLQYSLKKAAMMDKSGVPHPIITVEKHIPEKKEPINTEPHANLTR